MRNGMERGTGWGSRAAWDGLRGGEDGSSEHKAQQHAMASMGVGDVFERDRETHRGSRPIEPIARRPEKRCPDGQTPARERYRNNYPVKKTIDSNTFVLLVSLNKIQNTTHMCKGSLQTLNTITRTTKDYINYVDRRD